MQAQTSQQCVVVSFDTYCMNARGKINIYDIPILSCNIPLDNPNLANLVSRHVQSQIVMFISFMSTELLGIVLTLYEYTLYSTQSIPLSKLNC